MTRAFLISLCVFCIIFSLHEQSIFLPVRGCNQENIGFFHPLATAAPVAVTTEIETPKDCRCYMPLSNDFKAQSGQDQYLLHRVFFPQGGLCCSGVYVEFGARNGITHSNTYVFEKNLGWKGLLFEVDEREFKKLVHNRPNSDVVLGPVCPSDMDNVTIILSNIPGFTGTNDTYEPLRFVKDDVRALQRFKCHHLAKELKSRNMHRIDYMTIDTEGSEPEIVKDFPWDEFDVRVVQIEQLLASQFPAQAGKKEMIIAHLANFGYRLLSEFPVGGGSTTQDLIFTRNIDSYLQMTIESEKPSRFWPHEPKEMSPMKINAKL